jgi:hypothetical protein
MKLIFFLSVLFSATATRAQTNLLILEKGEENLKTYSEGASIIFQTIYNQWFEGVITTIRRDSVYVNGFPFHYKEIATIKRERKSLNYEADGSILMAAGVGVVILGAVNGWYRGDNAGNWYTPTSYVTAGALLVGGYLLLKGRYKYYHLGRKYKLTFLNLDLNKNP